MWDRLTKAAETQLLDLPHGDDLVTLRSYAMKRVAERTQKDAAGVMAKSVGREHQLARRPLQLFMVRRQKQLASCASHYIHFWHLLTVALEHGIPYVRIESLLLAQTASDVMKVLEASHLCAGNSQCQLMAETVLHERQSKTNIHLDTSIEDGQNFTANLYRQKEQRFLNETSCHDVFTDIIKFCDDNIPGCRDVNEAFGYNNDNDAWLSESSSIVIE